MIWIYIFFFFRFFSIIGHEKILNIVLVLEYFLKWVSLTSLSMKFLIYLLGLLPTMIKPYKFRPETPNLPQFIYWYFCLTGLYCHTVLLAGAMSIYCCCSVTKSCLTLQLHGWQHTRLPCPSLSPGVCSNFMSIESVMLSSYLILCLRLLLLPSIFPSIRVFCNELASHQVANILEFQLQHQSFQWIFRVDFL